MVVVHSSFTHQWSEACCGTKGLSSWVQLGRIEASKDKLSSQFSSILLRRVKFEEGLFPIFQHTRNSLLSWIKCKNTCVNPNLLGHLICLLQHYNFWLRRNLESYTKNIISTNALVWVCAVMMQMHGEIFTF